VYNFVQLIVGWFYKLLVMLDVTKWPIFSLLEQDEVANITKICVFGSSGNEAIYIKKNDDVFSIGSNCSGCLGLGLYFTYL